MKESLKTHKAFVLYAALSISLLFLLSACGGNASSGAVAPFEALPVSEVDESDSGLGEVVSDSSEENVASEGNAEVSTSEDEVIQADEVSAPVARVAPKFSLGEPQMKSSAAGIFNRASGQIQVLEFFAYWCPNCKALAPRIHGLEAAYAGEVEFTFLDIDDPVNKALKNEFGFYYQPLVLVIDGDGIVHMTWVGGGIDPIAVQAEIERLIALQG